MKRVAPIAGRCALVILLAGCVSPSDVQKLQSQITELQDQIAQVKKTSSSKQEVENVNQKIVDQTNTLLKSNAQLVVKVQQIDEKMNEVNGRIETQGARVDHIAQQITQAQHDVEALKAAQAAAAAAAATSAAPATTAVLGPMTPQPQTQPGGQMTVAAPSVPAGENPVEVYNSATRDYGKGNFDLAIAGFRDFMQKNPNSDLADNAAYWIGESLYSQKKYSEAIEAFDVVVNRYAKSDKVPGALLKKAYAYLALGDKARAIVQLQYVVHEHSKSEEAALARQKLKQLGVDSK